MNTDPARFDRVAEHPGFAAAPVEPARVPFIADVPSTAISIAISLVIATILLLDANRSTLGKLITLAVIVGVLGAAARLVNRMMRVRQAPTERWIGVIVKERTEVARRFGSRYPGTYYYATLQRRDGTRTEVVVPHAIVGRYAVDDIGIAYTKANVLVEFVRVDVQ